MFLAEPPTETLPLPDFRTVAGARVRRPTPNLLETLYICQLRQLWYQELARSTGQVPLGFVGSVDVSKDVEAVAASMRDSLALDLNERRRLSTWTEALRRFIESADGMGVLVMCSGCLLYTSPSPRDS